MLKDYWYKQYEIIIEDNNIRETLKYVLLLK